MATPLFTHAVAETPWLVVVCRDAAHFYHDTESGRLVWQLADTDIEGFGRRVDFDKLAVLFAKANGFGFGDTNVKKRKLEDGLKKKSGDIDASFADADEEGEHAAKIARKAPERLRDATVEDESGEREPTEDYGDLEDILKGGYPSIEPESRESQVEPSESPKQAPKSSALLAASLDLGYSSSEESDGGSEAPEDEDFGQNANDDPSDPSDSDVNGGLDLALDSDDAGGAEEGFLRLLDDHRAEISVFDPWFLVEEALLPKFAQDPAFYEITSPAAKESLFSKWVSRQSEKPDIPAGPYPNNTLLFLHGLQPHKGDVRRMYYGEFRAAHAAELEPLLASMSEHEAEGLFRQLRVTLNDYAAEEKRQRKLGKVLGNLKVAHVQSFLEAQSVLQFKKPANLEPATGSAFEKWVGLCNAYDLPKRVVCSATNFVVGDDKRLACYRRALGLLELDNA